MSAYPFVPLTTYEEYPVDVMRKRLHDFYTSDGRVPFSEDDLANRFSTEHANDLRYCEAWKCWLRWDGSR